MKPLLLVLALLATIQSASGQQPVPKETESAPPASFSQPGIFYDNTLDLHFYYPLEMPRTDMPSAAEHPSPEGLGQSAPGDRQRDEAAACLRIMLRADLPADKAGTRPATLDGTVRVPSPGNEGIRATIQLFEVDMNCVCKALRKKRDAAMREIAGTITHVREMEKMGPPLWYGLGTQKVHMSAAVGRLNPGEQPVLMMAMVTDYKHHVLMWIVHSNDAETFNSLTKSRVQFGGQPAFPLFAADVGPNGFTGVNILPK
jgi:hypothetical protein